MNICIQGGQRLSGEIYPSGSKNSAVAIIIATLLFDKPVILTNVPDISDVKRLVQILNKLGSKINWEKEKKQMVIDNALVKNCHFDQNDLGNMRGTVLLWGVILGRFREVNFSQLPGGCTLGERPFDTHYDLFKELGVEITFTEAGVYMTAHKVLAKEIFLTEVSPTATENAIMLAITLPGETIIQGAASEPQVQDLCQFLTQAGAKIMGVGSNVLKITGGQTLNTVQHQLLSDHYEITTFLALAAVTGGEIKIFNAIPKFFPMINREFRKFGIQVIYEKDAAIIKGGQKVKIQAKTSGQTLEIRPQPWPALPVDCLPLFIPLALAASSGQVLFHNWMYEAGLFWVSELQKMGANITLCDPHRVIINAGNKLFGAKLEAPFIIRAVVAMAMAAMIAEGETTILNADALYRGHPNFAQNLKKLGAKIEEVGAGAAV